MSQHMEALAKANEVRLARAEIKRDIKAMSTREGREAVAQIVLDPGELWCSAKLSEVLLCPGRSGPSFMGKVLASDRRCSLSPDKRLGSLTDRQRSVVAGALSLSCEPYWMAA